MKKLSYFLMFALMFAIIACASPSEKKSNDEIDDPIMELKDAEGEKDYEETEEEVVVEEEVVEGDKEYVKG